MTLVKLKLLEIGPAFWRPHHSMGAMTTPSGRGKGIVLKRIVKLIPCPIGHSAARKPAVDLKARAFTPFSHLVTMLFAQLTPANRTCKSESVEKVYRRTPGHPRHVGTGPGSAGGSGPLENSLDPVPPIVHFCIPPPSAQ